MLLLIAIFFLESFPEKTQARDRGPPYYGEDTNLNHLLTAVPVAFAQRCETMKWPPTEACAQRGSFLHACMSGEGDMGVI